MARLRFVGRSGQKFNRNDLLGKAKKKNMTENNKLNLLTKIHTGLKEFTQIAGTDSDEDEPFQGFIKQDITATLKRSVDLLEKESKEVLTIQEESLVKKVVKKSKGKMPSKDKTANRSYESDKREDNSLSGQSADLGGRSLKRTIPKGEKKDSLLHKTQIFNSSNSTTGKSMKGTIKIKFSGPGFYRQLTKGNFKKSRNRKDTENEDDAERTSEAEDDVASSFGSSRKRKRSVKTQSSKGSKEGKGVDVTKRPFRHESESNILQPVQSPKDSLSRNGGDIIIARGFDTDELNKSIYSSVMEVTERGEEGVEDRFISRKGRRRHVLSSHGDGLQVSSQDSLLVSPGLKSTQDDSFMKSPFTPSINNSSAGETPSAKKVPSLEAPLICSTKRQPKPNLKFLAYSTNEEESTPSGRQRRKSQGGSEISDRSPTYMAPSSVRIKDSKSALNAKNTDPNAQPVLPMLDKKDKCCICGNIRTSQKRLKDCQHWCCVECADFYIDHAPKFTKYKLNVACKYEPENCNMDSYRSWNQCPSCRFKKCLMLLPSPTQIVATLRKEAREGLLNQTSINDHSKGEGQSESLKGIDIITSCEKEYLGQVSESNPVKFISKSDMSRFKTRFGLNLPAEKPAMEVLLVSAEPPIVSDVKEADVESTVKEDKLIIDEDIDVETSKAEPLQPAPQQVSRGPRIKHVCREASVALGKTPAVFGGSNLRLSALPSFEKEKILRSEDGKVVPGAEEIKEKIKEEEDVENDAGAMIDKKDRDFMPKRPSKPSGVRSRGPFHKRSVRCGECESCRRVNCGKCKNCRDMPRFGGKGQIKQACEFRTCENPVPPLSHRKKMEGRTPKDVGGEGADAHLGTRKKTLKSFKDMVGLDMYPDPIRTSARKPGLSRIEMLNKMEADRSLMSTTHSHKTPNGSCLPATTCSVTTVLALESAVKLPENRDENYLEFAWSRGVSLVSMGLMSVRQVCKLCGSLGNSKMIYCNVCCEPFHEICMDERERPKSNKMDTWCCLQCQFCRVCFGQKDLLQCDLCQDSYHASCLSDNHPTKPSKKRKIWVCSKCVKCKSCGATTPGDGKDCSWTHDFSLCAACGDMMDKGNFCPVCQKCYQEDDWESQMIQCSVCNCWVHSRCEELSDEMYQIVTNMPEDVPFTCRVCRPSSELGVMAMTPWKKMISNELNKGLQNAIEAAQNSCGYGVLQSLDQFQTSLKKRKPPKGKNPLSPATTLSTTSIIKNSDAITRASANDAKNSSYVDEIDVCGEEDDEETRTRSDLDLSAVPGGYILQLANPQTSVGVPVPMVNAPLQENEEDASDSEDINSLDFIKSIVSYDDKHQAIPSSLSGAMVQGLMGSIPAMVTSQGKEESSHPSNIRAQPQVGTPPLGCLPLTNDGKFFGTAVTNGQVVCSASLPSVLTDSSARPLDFFGDCNKRKVEDDFSDGSNDNGIGNNNDDDDDDPIVGLEIIKEKIEKLDYTTVTELSSDVEQTLDGMSQMLNCDPVTNERICKSIKEAFYKQLSASFPWYKPNSDCTTSEKLANIHDPEDTIMPPYADHTYAIWKEKPVSPGPEQPSLFRKRNLSTSQSKSSDDSEKKVRRRVEEERRVKMDRLDDMRCCVLCWTVGDSNEGDCGRLLYMGQNEWIHVNCALWSAEVFEEADGVLQKIHSAAARGRKLRCDACGKQGATVGCCQMDCNANFHFPCARRKHCAFVESKKVFCSSHVAFADARMVSNFNVDRRVCLDFENNKFFKKQWISSLNSSNICILVGSMTIESMGKLTSLSDAKHNLFPVDYCSSRLFWSTKDARKRTYYRFRIVEVQPKSSKFSQRLGSKFDFTVPHDPSDPCYDKIVSARFARDHEDEFSDASTLSISDGTDEFEHLNDFDSEEEAQLLHYSKRQITPKPISDLMLTMDQSMASTAETPLPMRRGRGRPPGQKRGQVVEPPLAKKSKTASLISKLRQQTSEDDSCKKKQKPTKNQNSNQSNSWQHGQQMRELLLNSSTKGALFDSGMDAGEFVDVEREDELDVDLGNRDEEDELSLVQIVDRLNKAAARSNQSRGNPTDQRSGVSQFFDPLDDQDWVNNVFSSSSSEKKSSFSPVGINTSAGSQPVPVDGANNFFLNDIQSILLMHQQQQKEVGQKQSAKPPVFYINQNIAQTQQTHVRANTSASGTPVQFLIGGQNFIQQQSQQAVTSPQSQQQAIVMRRAASSSVSTAAITQNSNIENTPQPKYKLILVKNVSSARNDVRQIDQLDGHVDDSDTGSEKGDQGQESDKEMKGDDATSPTLDGVQISHGQDAQSLKRKRLDDDNGDESSDSAFPPKRLHADSESTAADPVQISNEMEMLTKMTAPFNPSIALPHQPRVHSLQSESQVSLASLGSSVSIDDDDDDEDEEAEIDVEDDENDGSIYDNKISGVDELEDEESDDEDDNGDDGDDEDDGDSEEQEAMKVNEGSMRIHSHESFENQTKIEQKMTTSFNFEAGMLSCEEKRKSHKERIFKLRPMTHTHLPRAEAEEEIENCSEDDEEDMGVQSVAAHFDPEVQDKSSKLSQEESSCTVEEEARADKKKEEMKAKLSARYVPHLMFEITSDDGFRVLSDSVNRAWKSVIEKVKEARANAGMKPISYAGLTGLYLSGLEHPAFIYILEQMPECRGLKNYHFKYHKEQWLCNEEQLVESKYGCARCEPFTRSKHKNDMFSFLLSEYRRPPEVDASQIRAEDTLAVQRRNIEQPLTKRFKHMKANAKEVVGVYRSPIHGRGLFCKKDIEAGEMIIEYSGEVIRTSLTDKRERAYEARGIGCYMFRKDLDHVIDSTVMGNASRFINHSCEPNCYCRVIQVENRKRIIIFAQRNIRRGEELTYDYKFPIEEVKIPCLCGSRKCRKYLN